MKLKIKIDSLLVMICRLWTIIGNSAKSYGNGMMMLLERGELQMKWSVNWVSQIYVFGIVKIDGIDHAKVAKQSARLRFWWWSEWTGPGCQFPIFPVSRFPVFPDSQFPGFHHPHHCWYVCIYVRANGGSIALIFIGSIDQILWSLVHHLSMSIYPSELIGPTICITAIIMIIICLMIINRIASIVISVRCGCHLPDHFGRFLWLPITGLCLNSFPFPLSLSSCST